jgi:hypothetical protein
VSGPTPRHLKRYAGRCLRLARYFKCPGDGRVKGQIGAETLLWALIVGEVIRQGAFHAIEALVGSRARRALAVARAFGDDSLAYFTERLDPDCTRQALVLALHQAKRNKAFENSRFIGLALDGTGAARTSNNRCRWCRPIRDSQDQVVGYNHRFSLISVVGTGLSLPFDVEPYGPGDSEQAASVRLLKRAVQQLGSRFAGYVVADGLYAQAPFLHQAAELGLHPVVRLKENLPELLAAAKARFEKRRPSLTFEHGKDDVEIWDCADFDPWDSLNWTTVRVLRYRQRKPDGRVIEAYWLTDFSSAQVGSRALFLMAKSRWEIENQGFNEGKNHYGMEKIRHHHENSLLIGWLLNCLAMTLERLYRLRYLHRGRHQVYTPIELVRHLWLSLGRRPAPDTS